MPALAPVRLISSHYFVQPNLDDQVDKRRSSFMFVDTSTRNIGALNIGERRTGAKSSLKMEDQTAMPCLGRWREERAGAEPPTFGIAHHLRSLPFCLRHLLQSLAHTQPFC